MRMGWAGNAGRWAGESGKEGQKVTFNILEPGIQIKCVRQTLLPVLRLSSQRSSFHNSPPKPLLNFGPLPRLR